MTAECGSRKQKLLYDNRFNQMIGRSLAKVDRLEYQIEDLEEGKGYMLESDHRREMKELKQQHREELEEETYQVAKKKEKEKFQMEIDISHLKHENEILKRKVDVLEKMLQIKSNNPMSYSTSEMDDENEMEDEKELEKEEINLD